ncbi:MAG: type II secretion system protein [Verrucomicrobiota bacterium]
MRKTTQPFEARPPGNRAFTLLELLIVISIIAVMIALTIPVFNGFRSKAERAQSIQNLKSIYTALSAHLDEYRSWPIAPQVNREKKFEFWKETLEPYGILERHLIANAHIRSNKEEAEKIGSYIIMEFDPYDDLLPRRWGNQPWAFESRAFDGTGQWIIRSNGKVDQELSIFSP